MFLFRKKERPHEPCRGHLEPIKYRRGHMQLLDQRKLPLTSKFIEIKNVQDGWKAINDMAVRGAPGIAISASLALAVDLVKGGAGSQFDSPAAAAEAVKEKFDYLVTSRPTAVNLSTAAGLIKGLAETASAEEGATAESVVEKVVQAAENMAAADVEENKAIGEFGSQALLEAAAEAGRGAPGGQLRVLTICNTGSLATAGYGTALGVIRSLHAQGKLARAYACETRPYNQGSRLTAYELVHDKVPATLICDSAAPSLMAKGEVDAVVVGADRITANGDTANKIGTSMLALAAAHYGVPFFVAASHETVDLDSPDGSFIPIEQRPAEEVTHSMGRRIAAEGIDVWNPGFDVTSGELITGIITEKGCVHAKGSYDMAEFLRSIPAAVKPQAQSPQAEQKGPVRMAGEALTEATVVDYICQRKDLCDRVGPADTASQWKVKEVGDGNINFVFIVEGPIGALCVKQALGFVRCVGESWPLTQERLKFEVEAMRYQAEMCPEHVPAIYDYDPQESVMVMQYLAPPHIILRHAMNEGVIYPKLAEHMSTFLATTLFRSSFLAVPATDFRRRVGAFTNTDMCALTEQVIFTDPLFDAPNNGFLRPQMQEVVEGLWKDVELKRAVTSLKQKFLTSTEALLHGDVHTGSMMVSQDSTWVIDAEFAFYGPIFFDVGKFIGNLLLYFYALDARASSKDAWGPQRAWVVSAIKDVWHLFSEKFLALWDKEASKGGMFSGDSFQASNPSGSEAIKSYQTSFMETLYSDCMKMAGTSMIRRVVGIAGVADLRDINNPEVRATCERRALRMARRLLLEKTSGIEAVVAAADKERQDGCKPYHPLP